MRNTFLIWGVLAGVAIFATPGFALSQLQLELEDNACATATSIRDALSDRERAPQNAARLRVRIRPGDGVELLLFRDAEYQGSRAISAPEANCEELRSVALFVIETLLDDESAVEFDRAAEAPTLSEEASFTEATIGETSPGPAPDSSEPDVRDPVQTVPTQTERIRTEPAETERTESRPEELDTRGEGPADRASRQERPEETLRTSSYEPRTRLALSAGFRAGIGELGYPAIGGVLSFRHQHGRRVLELRTHFVGHSHFIDMGLTGGRFFAAELQGNACVRAIDVSAFGLDFCGGVTLGILVGTGIGYPRNLRALNPSLRFPVALAASIYLGPIVLRPTAGISANPAQHQFADTDGSLIFAQEVFSIFFSLEAGYHWGGA